MEYLSLGIALLALTVSAYSVFENRRNNRISNAPALVGHESEGPTKYSYSIINKGTGPAYFEKVEYFLNGQPIVDKSLREAVREVLLRNGIRHISTITHLAEKGIMAPGEETLLGKIEFPAEDAEKFQNLEDEFAFRITFTNQAAA